MTDTHGYRWEPDNAPAPDRVAPTGLQLDRTTWGRLALGAVGVAGVAAIVAMTAGQSGASWQPERMTAAVLADDVRTNAENKAGDDLQLEDVHCLDTARTAADGTGMYLCSWRSFGALQQWVYSVEVGADGAWSSSNTSVPGSVLGLSADQAARVLVEPFEVSAERWVELAETA